MSYQFITKYDSPNFTEGNEGRDFIVLHWWDDPAKNPSFIGTVNTLINPSRGASAHFVATGTDRQVACLVNLNDTAWHAGDWGANRHSLGIEADPRCRDEDYDVVAELIANIRSAYGDLPIRKHSEFMATRCPGNWDIARLDALARTKDGSGDWGVVTDIKPVTPPAEPTKPVEPEPVVEPTPEPEKPTEPDVNPDDNFDPATDPENGELPVKPIGETRMMQIIKAIVDFIYNIIKSIFGKE